MNCKVIKLAVVIIIIMLMIIIIIAVRAIIVVTIAMHSKVEEFKFIAMGLAIVIKECCV